MKKIEKPSVAQEFLSADTSINSTKLPSIYGKLKKAKVKLVNAIDYGCGRYFDSYKLSNVVGFDINWKNDESLLERNYNEGICCNVLNVIKEPEIRKYILEVLHSICKTTYIVVYEGNKSGVSKKTKKGYQMNQKHDFYMHELEEVFGPGNVTYKNGMFTCLTK